MSLTDKSTEGLGPRLERTSLNQVPAEDLGLEEALKHFKMSVHAWSDAAYSRPRSAAKAQVKTARKWNWRVASGWALAGLLVAGGVSDGFYLRHQRLEQAKVAAAARLAEQQKELREQQAKEEEEDLLAKVDSDVSREVPSAMEPLAQLMDDEAK